MRTVFRVAAAIAQVSLSVSLVWAQATWTPLNNLMPAAAGTMILLTDGTVMVENNNDVTNWLRLTPDSQGSYINGTWSSDIAPMGTARLYFASNVLPSGKVWVLGGEYSGHGKIVQDNSGTGELFDPVANIWTPISPLHGQSCRAFSTFPGTLASGSPVITQINSTASWQPGWSITGTGIPASSVIVSVDSDMQIHISQNATQNGSVVIGLSAQSTGATTAGSNVITGIPSTAGYLAGWGISGAGIPTGATISRVDSASQIHISQNATATAVGVTLTFAIATSPSACAGDTPSILLPGGIILVGDIRGTLTHVYNVATDTWTTGATKAYNDTSSEEGWALLSNGKVLTYDISKSNAGSGYAELYDPVTGGWSGISPADGTASGLLPVLGTNGEPVLGTNGELGPIVRLYDDRMFAIGATGHTALYTPATNTWAAGPDITGTLSAAPFPFAADDAPAAILPNGHVILAGDAGLLHIASSGTIVTGSPVITGIPSTAQFVVGLLISGTGIPRLGIKSIDSPSQVTMTANATATAAGEALIFGGTNSPPAQLFDFDPVADSISPVSPASPDANLASSSATFLRMLMLPTGQMLFADESRQLWVYTPQGTANPSLQPAINSVSSRGNGLFTLGGTQLSGQSAGSMYGDDVQTNENYPIVSFTSSSGNVYYARTTNWSYIGVGGGSLPQTVDFTLNPAMPAGTYSIVVSAAGISSASVQASVSSDRNTITANIIIPPPAFSTAGIDNAASFRGGAISPGEMITIFGTNLGPASLVGAQLDAQGNLASTLGGTQVLFDGIAAPLVYTSNTQISAMVPYEVSGHASTQIVISSNGQPSAPITVPVTATAPALFTAKSNGSGPAAILNQDGSPNSLYPAPRGSVITLFATGEGQTSPAGFDGRLAGSSLPKPVAPVSVQIGGVDAVVQYYGAAPGEVAGFFQVNVVIPASVSPGPQPIVLTVGNNSSPANVTVNVSLVATPVSASLVGWWMFSEGSGTSAGDSSGNNNTGTLMRGASWTTGLVGDALSLDGATGYVQGTSSGTNFPIGSAARTISAWVKVANAPGADNAILHYGTASGSTAANFHLYMTGSPAGHIGFGNGYGFGTVQSGKSVADGNWHLVVGVYDGDASVGGDGIAHIYIDNAQDASGKLSTTPATGSGSNWRIGDFLAGGTPFHGDLEDLRIYSRALSLIEVQALYAAQPVSVAPIR